MVQIALASSFLSPLFFPTSIPLTKINTPAKHFKMEPVASAGISGQHGSKEQNPSPRKIIIDTDPGVDDAMAILLAFQSPELDVIGMTTTFGNVHTPLATQNALHLRELAGREDVPVAQGETTSLMGVEKTRIADFVHGSDGLGNTNPPPPRGSPIAQSAAEFLIERVTERPGEITVVALGPLTNLAKAIQLDPDFPKKVGEIIILGGAFFVNGNVNPAAEANVFGDTDAADIVFTCGAETSVIGINITHQIIMTAEDLLQLRDCGGRFSKYIHDAAQFYLDYHTTSYGMQAIYLHDPATMVAAIDPSLFTYQKGVVRVQRDGIMKGLTLLNALPNKKWMSENEWTKHPPVKVAVAVNADKVVQLVKDRLMAPSLSPIPAQSNGVGLVNVV